MEPEQDQETHDGGDYGYESPGTSATRADRFQLREAAERLSVSPEQLSILSIEEKLAQLEDEFRCSAEYALKKNADLYRRLA
jgi:antitoxin FitA